MDPTEVPTPPGKVPIRRNGVWRKRWRYLGAFSDELLLCAARVQVGPIGQTFWAIWDRERREMHERTHIRPPFARGEVWTESQEEADTDSIDWAPDDHGTVVRIEAEPHGGREQVRAFLHAGQGNWRQVVCPTGEDEGYVWTRKRVVPVECDVRIGERKIKVGARGVEDESCGYHPHHTVWSWSAGVGEATDGRPVGWNLVSGINDPPERSERSIWVDGEPTEPGPVSFEGLDAIDFEDGAHLRFEPECERSHSQNLLLVRYTYRQPFGRFTGSLPGLELEHGIGVMEHHDAVW